MVEPDIGSGIVGLSGTGRSDMRLVLIATAGALLVGPASAAPRVDVPLLPGAWEITSRIAIKAAPGVPPMIAAMMAKAGAQGQTQHRCLKAKDLQAKPESAFIGPNCRAQKARIGGGTYELKAICSDPDGGVGTMDVKGAYTPQTFDQTAEIKRTSGPGGQTALSIRTTARRLTASCA